MEVDEVEKKTHGREKGVDRKRKDGGSRYDDGNLVLPPDAR